MSFTKIPAPTYRTVDFTSSGTWVCPSGVYSAEFFVVGAGGGGGGVSLTNATFNASGSGGGGGAVKKVNLAVTPGSSYTITIGAKGTGSAGAIGGNGGFTEVLLSGTTLIKCWGGQGGGATISDAATRPTTSRTIAGAGGEGSVGATGANKIGPGGGGAIYGSNTSFAVPAATGTRNYGSEGLAATSASTSASNGFDSMGQGGVDGYGAGGSGGVIFTSSAPVINQSGYSAFAGAGAYLTATGAANGGNAVANTGCGGGGSASCLTTTASAGGNGADGLVRINYFA